MSQAAASHLMMASPRLHHPLYTSFTGGYLIITARISVRSCRSGHKTNIAYQIVSHRTWKTTMQLDFFEIAP